MLPAPAVRLLNSHCRLGVVPQLRGADHLERAPPCRAAARHGGARRPRRGDPPGEAVERHRVGARRAVAARANAPRRSGPSACGSVPLAAFTISKLSWLHRSEPESWARLSRVCLPHDWLTLQLTGELITDRGDASGTGYWSPRRGEWALGAARHRRRRARLGRRRCRRCAGRTRRCPHAARRAPSSRRVPATTWLRRWPWVPSRAGWWCRSARRARSSRRVPRQLPTRRDRLPASPTRPVASFLSCARPTPRRSPTQWRAGVASTWRRSTRWRWRRRPVPAAWSSCRISTVSAHRTVPTLRARSWVCVRTPRRRSSHGPRSKVSRVACSTDSTRCSRAAWRRPPRSR